MATLRLTAAAVAISAIAGMTANPTMAKTFLQLRAKSHSNTSPTASLTSKYCATKCPISKN